MDKLFELIQKKVMNNPNLKSENSEKPGKSTSVYVKNDYGIHPPKLKVKESSVATEAVLVPQQRVDTLVPIRGDAMGNAASVVVGVIVTLALAKAYKKVFLQTTTSNQITSSNSTIDPSTQTLTTPNSETTTPTNSSSPTSVMMGIGISATAAACIRRSFGSMAGIVSKLVTTTRSTTPGSGFLMEVGMLALSGLVFHAMVPGGVPKAVEGHGFDYAKDAVAKARIWKILTDEMDKDDWIQALDDAKWVATVGNIGPESSVVFIDGLVRRVLPTNKLYEMGIHNITRAESSKFKLTVQAFKCEDSKKVDAVTKKVFLMMLKHEKYHGDKFELNVDRSYKDEKYTRIYEGYYKAQSLPLRKSLKGYFQDAATAILENEKGVFKEEVCCEV